MTKTKPVSNKRAHESSYFCMLPPSSQPYYPTPWSPDSVLLPVSWLFFFWNIFKANFQQIDVHLDFLVQNVTVKEIFVTLLPLYRTSSHENSFQNKNLIITDSIHCNHLHFKKWYLAPYLLYSIIILKDRGIYIDKQLFTHLFSIVQFYLIKVISNVYT